MSEIGKLWVSISAKTDELHKDLDGVQGKMQSVGGNISKAGGAMTKNVTAPVLAAGGAALAMANKYAGMGDDIAKTSSKLGISTDALQEMDYWAGQNGITAQTLERGVGRLNQRIGRAADGNAKYAEAFEDVGVSLHDTQGNLRDTEDVMGDTISALMEIEDPQLRSARASEIFGTKMARDLMPALEDGSLSIEDAKEKIHEMGGVMSGEAIEAAVKYQDSMDDLKREFGGVFMEIATKLIPIIVDSLLPAIKDHVIPAVRDFVERIGELIDWFQNLNPSVKKVIGTVIGLVVAIGPILLIVGKLITVFAAIIGVVGKVIGVIMGLGKVFAVAKVALLVITGPIGLIIAAIAALIAIGVLVYKNWDKIKAFAIKIWGAIKDYFISNMQETRDFFVGIWESIKNIFSNALESIIDFFFKYHPLGIIISNWEEIKAFFSGVWDSIKDIFSKALQAVTDHVKSEFERTKDLVTNIWNSIKDFILDLWDKLKSGVTEKAVALKDSVINVIGKALEWIQELPGKALQWGKDIIQGLINGVKSMASAVGNAIKGVASNAVDSVKGFLGMSSPSKVFRDLGINVGEGFEQGVDRMKNGVAGTMQNMVRPPQVATATAAPVTSDVSAPTGGGGGITNTFNIEQMNVRDDKDVEQIARELYRLQGRRDRGVS